MAKITGIGGVFLKCKGDSAALSAWYQKHLGMQLESWGGAVLRWPDDKAEDKGLTVWNLANNDSQWFSPSDSSYMINYRVDNLDELLAQLHADGVAIHSGPESHENGKFAWIMDPDGKLWEPMLWDDKKVPEVLARATQSKPDGSVRPSPGDHARMRGRRPSRAVHAGWPSRQPNARAQ